MKKYIKIILITIMFVFPFSVIAIGDNKPNEEISVSYKGATVFSADSNEKEMTYSSINSNENALLVSTGMNTIDSCKIEKSGDSSGESADFYGTNAGILVYNNATLNIINSDINTKGAYANGVFAYKDANINITNSIIKTSSNNSGGIMVAGGGTILANICTVTTTGNSSAAIRSDRGGGIIIVNGGSYSSSGTGSPVIYSTANITVNDATLTSTSAEGIVVEGANSVSINNAKLIDTNRTLNGNSETYKNIFLYQSMSGDAQEGTSQFSASDSSIITNKGDTIFVTNTKASIELENNDITNRDGAFLRIQSGKWGNSGSNGGIVSLNMSNQKVNGAIIVDEISSLSLLLRNKSVFIGSINSDNTSKNISVNISSNSIISLTKDTYINKLNNGSTNNSNIYSNGEYKLFVNGNEVEINNSIYKEESTNNNGNNNNKDKDDNNDYSKIVIDNDEIEINKYYIVYGVSALLVILGIILVIRGKKGDNNLKENL